MKQKPPEFAELKDEYQYYSLRLYGELRERQRWHEELYNQTVKLGLTGKAFQTPTYTPDAMLIIDDPADHLGTDKILVDQVPRVSKQGVETKPNKELADANGAWMQRLLDMWKRNEPYYYRAIIHNQCYRGEAFPKLDIHWDTIGDPEKYPGLPMEVIVPDSIMVYASLDLEMGIPRSVFWERVTSISHVLGKLEEWNKEKEGRLAVGSRKDSELVYFVEWYKGPWMGYMVADMVQNSTRFWLQPVPFQGEIVTPNPLGHPPFIRAYSGLGTASRDGDPIYPVRGILTGVERVLIGKSRTYTKIDTLTSKHVLPIPVMDMVDDTLPLTAEELDFDAGAIKKTGPNRVKGITYLLPPPIPQAILSQAIEQDKILENYRPAVTRGVPMPGEPASSLVTRLGLAVLKWTPIQISASKAVSRLLEMALEVVDIAGKEHIADGIEVGGIYLKAADVSGYYRADIDVEPGTEEQLRFDIFTALQLWDKIPNRKWIVEKYLHQTNATQFLLDLDTDKAQEKLMDNLSYMTAFFAGIFEKKGMKEEMARLQKMVEQGLLPGPGMPEGSPAMPPPATSPSATPPGAGGSPEQGVVSLGGTHQQPGLGVPK